MDSHYVDTGGGVLGGIAQHLAKSFRGGHVDVQVERLDPVALVGQTKQGLQDFPAKGQPLFLQESLQENKPD